MSRGRLAQAPRTAIGIRPGNIGVAIRKQPHLRELSLARDIGFVG